MRSALLLLLLNLLILPGIGQEPQITSQPHTVVGIGAVVTMKDGVPIIHELILTGPAIGSGLQAEDKIIKVDGTATTGLDLIQVVNLIRGSVGTTVKITVAREGDKTPLTYTVVREPIHLDAK
jgi:carboxyl-terminal processing protease